MRRPPLLLPAYEYIYNLPEGTAMDVYWRENRSLYFVYAPGIDADVIENRILGSIIILSPEMVIMNSTLRFSLFSLIAACIPLLALLPSHCISHVGI